MASLVGLTGLCSGQTYLPFFPSNVTPYFPSSAFRLILRSPDFSFPEIVAAGSMTVMGLESGFWNLFRRAALDALAAEFVLTLR